MQLKDIAEGGGGFILGYLLGWLIKKALKIALVVIAAVVIFTLITQGDTSSLSSNATNILDKGKKTLAANQSLLDQIKDFLKDHSAAAIGFFAGLITGLFRG